jgi:VanZ family protein
MSSILDLPADRFVLFRDDMMRTDQIIEEDTLGRDGVDVSSGRGGWIWFVLACVATVAVLLVSHIPQEVAAGMQGGFGDKLPHAVAYGVLTWCWLKAFDSGPTGRSMRLMLGIMLVPIAIGTVAELTQPLVGRCCDLMDWVANVAGVVIACVVWGMLKRWRSV